MNNLLAWLFIAGLIGCFSPGIKAQTQELNRMGILSGRTDTLQNDYFLSRLHEQFDRRREEVRKASVSEETLLARRDKMRKWLDEKVGSIAHPPLHPVFSAKVDMGSYTVEKLAFESKPNHHVTGLFYLPKTGTAPYPAVYIPCGHTELGKAYPDYQRAARLFAMNGFAVLQADPVCQGERFQYLDKTGKPLTRGGTYMHDLLGQALLLTGSNTLIEELEDNVRCLDFLQQQPAVDQDRLAVAGHSGGGTQATYLAAFDRRIKAVTPVCYIATTEKKLDSIGSQDGCQQLWGEGKAGIEEQDFLFMAAPVPVSILSTEEDFFSLSGAKKAYADLKGMYSVLHSPEKVDQFIGPGGHGWRKLLREASVRWCKRWLMNDSTPVIEPDGIGFFEDPAQVNFCSTGQVMSYFKNERSVVDLNRERLAQCDQHRAAFQKINTPSGMIARIKELTGFEEPGKDIKIIKTDTVRGNGYRVIRLFIERDKKFKFLLPALMFIPDGLRGKSPADIFVSQDGKGTATDPSAEIIKALDLGHIVLAVDISNTGELKDKRRPEYDNQESYIAKLPLYEGKTLLTYRAEDILIAARFLQDCKEVDSRETGLVSVGYTGPAALHAAAIGQHFKWMKIIGSLESWREVAGAYHSKDQLGNIVPDALDYYDLPDLIRLAVKTRVEVIAPADENGDTKVLK